MIFSIRHAHNAQHNAALAPPPLRPVCPRHSDIYWTAPRNLPTDKMSFQVNDVHKPGISSMHPKCAAALFADGHTQTISNSIDREVLKALLTIAGGEIIQRDF